MKKLRQIFLGMTCSIAMILMLSGCGASKSSAYDYKESAYEYGNYASDDLYSESVASEVTEEAMMESSNSEVTVQDTSRKLIRNVNLSAETEEFDTLLQTVNNKVSALGGYIENSVVYNGSNYYGSSRRSATLTIRIPAEKLDDFLSTIGEESNIVSRSEDVTDVTLSYVDMESHKKVLLAEQERLLELLDKAESIEDIITIESRLSEVRYQIESMESQLRTMDNQVSFSTVTLDVEEVERLTPVAERSIWERIGEGFSMNLIGAGRDVVDFFVNVIIELPYIFLFLVKLAIFVVIAIFVVKIVRKQICKRKEKKEQKQAPKNTAEDKEKEKE